MSYVEFDLKSAIQTFGLARDEDSNLFRNVEPLEPSDFLRGFLDEFSPVALGVNTEQARREYIISPILTEAKRRSKAVVNVLPGVLFAVDAARGLTGYCDYLIAQSPELYFVDAPIVAVVEAKREDLVAGLGQCVAEMVAIQMFNERDGKPRSVVYGCVTSGSNWRFLKLAGNALSIDVAEYHLHEVAKILGILIAIISE
jgi:hypothetical protein